MQKAVLRLTIPVQVVLSGNMKIQARGLVQKTVQSGRQFFLLIFLWEANSKLP